MSAAPAAPKPTTKSKGIHELLSELDQHAQRIGREIAALDDELVQLGGRDPRRLDSAIPTIKAEIAAARADAKRKGVEPQLADLESKLADAHARIAAIGEELTACRTATKALAVERIELIRSRREEIDGLARDAADAVAELKRTARGAAADLLVAYQHARAEISLGASALPPTPKVPLGVTVHPDEFIAVEIADKEMAGAYRQSYKLGDASYWQSVERVASESVS